MNETYAVKLHCGKPTIELVEKKDSDDVLSFCYREIGCDMIEIPPTRHLKAPYIMIADEEGLLKHKPILNILGSYFYGMQDHGNPIVGHALIMKEKGAHIAWLTKAEYEDVMQELAELFVPALDAALKNAR